MRYYYFTSWTIASRIGRPHESDVASAETGLKHDSQSKLVGRLDPRVSCGVRKVSEPRVVRATYRPFCYLPRQHHPM